MTISRCTEKVYRVWDWLVWNFLRPSYQCEAELPFEGCEGVACCVRHMGHWGKHMTNNGEIFSDGC